MAIDDPDVLTRLMQELPKYSKPQQHRILNKYKRWPRWPPIRQIVKPFPLGDATRDSDRIKVADRNYKQRGRPRTGSVSWRRREL